jgi:hypothetical protein
MGMGGDFELDETYVSLFLKIRGEVQVANPAGLDDVVDE